MHGFATCAEYRRGAAKAFLCSQPAVPHVLSPDAHPPQGPTGPIVPAPVHGGGYQPALDGDEEEGRPEPGSPADSDAEMAGPRPPPASAAGGAASGPDAGADADADADAPVAGPSMRPAAADGGVDGDEPQPVRPRRVLGPAAPPPEVLAAAAELAEALVGPPPPDLVEEDDGATPATREEAVKVLLKVLACANASHPLPMRLPDDSLYSCSCLGPLHQTSQRRGRIAALLSRPFSPAARPPPLLHPSPPTQRMQAGANAYKLLGVEQKATAAEVRKAYWKLSLLVHPDKCDHPGAADAFQAR